MRKSYSNRAIFSALHEQSLREVKHTFPVSNIGVLTNGKGPSAHCFVGRFCCVVAILKMAAMEMVSCRMLLQQWARQAENCWC